MADIIQRSLNLSVVGEDEASDVFAAIADQVDDLQARFETAFGGMATYAEDAASTIADAANSWAPVWISQLEAVETAAASAFSTIASSAASSAVELGSAWETQLGLVSAGAVQAAAEVDAAFGSVGADPEANGETVATVWLGNLSKISEGAVGAAADVDAALGSVAADPEANGDAVVAAWSESFDRVMADADAAAAAVDASLGSVGAGGEFSGDAVVAEWSSSLDKIVADAATAAAEVDASLGSVGVTGDTTGASVAADWEANLGKIASSAEGTAAEVIASFGSIDEAALGSSVLSTGSADVSAAGAGTIGASSSAEKVAAGDAASLGAGDVLGGMSLSSLFSGGLMTGIFGALGLAGANASVNAVQGIGLSAEQLGVPVKTAVQTELATSAFGSQTSLDRLEARFEAALQKVELQGAPMLSGKPVSVGLGKEAVEPESLKALLTSSSGLSGPAAGLALLFGSPKQAAADLSGQSFPTQMAMISTALDKIANANEKTQIATDIFGGRAGVSAIPLLENWQKAMGIAKGETAGAGGIMSALQNDLGASGKAGGMQFQESLKMSEIGMEAGLYQLTPTLEKLTQAIVKLESWLESEFGTKNSTGSKILSAVAPSPNTTAGIANILVPGTGIDVKAVEGLLGYLGGGGTSNQQTINTMMQVAAKNHLDPAAFVSDSYAESGLNPTSRNSIGAAGLFQFMPKTWATDYQKVYGTAPTMAPDQASVAVQAQVAAWAMAHEGIAGMTGTTALSNMIGDLHGVAGVPNSTANGGAGFEHPGPGPGGSAGDWSRGLPFMQALEKTLQSTKAQAPEIPKTIAAELNKMLDEVKKADPVFSASHEKMIDNALRILESSKPKLTASGEELMKGLLSGLQHEEGPLTEEAKKIASMLEADLNAALKIKSPSEMTAEMGEHLMAGLGVGIQRGAQAATVTAGQAAVGVAGALGGGGSRTAGTGQVLQLTVPVTIDGREIGRVSSEYLLDNLKLIGRTP